MFERPALNNHLLKVKLQTLFTLVKYIHKHLKLY